MGPVVDAETGFVYLRARYYDPATGQFLTRDPIEAQTREAYGYVGGNPLNDTDPSGLWPGSWAQQNRGKQRPGYGIASLTRTPNGDVRWFAGIAGAGPQGSLGSVDYSLSVDGAVVLAGEFPFTNAGGTTNRSGTVACQAGNWLLTVTPRRGGRVGGTGTAALSIEDCEDEKAEKESRFNFKLDFGCGPVVGIFGDDGRGGRRPPKPVPSMWLA